jgi:hypothetical protein
VSIIPADITTDLGTVVTDQLYSVSETGSSWAVQVRADLISGGRVYEAHAWGQATGRDGRDEALAKATRRARRKVREKARRATR